jgi:outer membrane lipoprotein-sorting protein
MRFKLAVMIILLLGIVFTPPVVSKELNTAREIVDKGFNYLRDKTSHAMVTMVIHRAEWERRVSMKVWTQGQDESLFKIVSPSKDKGNGTLKKGRDMWIYNPKINRVIKLPPSMMSQSWMGSDFSNNDLAKTDSLVKDYTHQLIRTETHDGKKVYVIKSLPKPNAPVVWGMLELKIREDLIFLSEEFFDETLTSVKKMTGEDIRMLGGKLFPKVWKIQKSDLKDDYTQLIYNTLEFNINLEDNMFTVSSLKNPLR